MTITVFLLDDHEMVRRGLRDILATEDDIDVIGEAGTVDEGAAASSGCVPTWRSSTSSSRRQRRESL